MTICDEVLAATLLREPLDPAAEAHVQACDRCAAEAPLVRAVAGGLDAFEPAPPSPGLGAGVLRAARPALRVARRARWVAIGRALAVALVPLPLVVLLDATLVRALHGALAVVLPDGLSTYLAFNYAALLALLLALTYAAVPLLVERQARGRWMESHV